ncbi:MAG: hypothetical protein IJ399_03020 [Bacilli bacterium]|nr:hypothetical protein [Bacilli bacterium]
MNELDIKNVQEKHGLLITSLRGIAKENPEILPFVLTDFNIMLVMSDLDIKLSKNYTLYLNNKNRTLLDPSSSGLQSALMQLYGAELLENYILYQTFNNIALDRGLDISMQSNIKDIERIYSLDGAKILKKRK